MRVTRTLPDGTSPGASNGFRRHPTHNPVRSAQQKISGTFRTEAGAHRFATVRSYIETGRKHDENPLDLLIQLFTGAPWTIPPASPAAGT